MTRGILHTTALCMTLWLTTTPAIADTPTLEYLGDLAGGAISSTAYGVSNNGTVVGGSTSVNGAEAFIWTSGTGMVGLGDFPGGSFSSYARNVSDDGSVVVGQGKGASGSSPFRWTSGTGMVDLGTLSPTIPTDSSNALSDDGSIVVGYSKPAAGYEAFRWTSGTGMIGLGDLPGSSYYSFASATNGDGSIVVGSSYSANGDEAMYWTSGSGMVGIGDLPGGTFSSTAWDISDDGSIIVGYGQSASGREAFRWTSGSGMVGLGDLPGGLFRSTAYGISGNGTTIIGEAYSASGQEAFFWNQTDGMQSIKDYLVSKGVDVTNWSLTVAYDISDNGQMIVGEGIYNGNTSAFLVNLAAAAVTSVEDLSKSLKNVTQTTQQISAITKQYLPQGVFLAQHASEFSVPITRTISQQPQIINTSRPSEIAPAAGDSDETLQTQTIATNLSMFVMGAYSTGHDNDFGNNEWSGAAGLNYQLNDDTIIGAGIIRGQSHFTLDFDGSSNMTATGSIVHAGYEPQDSNIRLFGTTYGVLIDLDTNRGYLNGASTEFSRGKSDGWSYGGAAKIGWEENLSNTSTSIMPYAEARYSRTKIDSYTETGGSFAATFSKQDIQSLSSRVGVELTQKIDDTLEVTLRPAWGHRITGNGGTVTATVGGLPQTMAWSSGEKDWAEGSVGASWQATPSLHISSDMTARTSKTAEPMVTLMLGANFKW